ncbi:MAG: ThiF family adenylyltransferase [Acidobacteriaceae bacterium]
MPLTGEMNDVERYSRQTLFPGIGMEGQKRISAAQVTIVGCGAIGAAVASLLARAGVGTLRIIDRDFVEFSNLQRQVLFDEADAEESLPKAIAAARKIAAFNSAVAVDPRVNDLAPGNAEELLGDCDVMLDATDNFETRYLINDVAVKQGKPWIYAAAVASYCVTMNILPGETACLACIFPAGPKGAIETCDTAGIIAPAVNYVASIEAAECLKLLVGARDKLRRTMMSYDVWTNNGASLSAAKPRGGCQCCQLREFVHLAGEGRAHITLCGRNSVQIHERERPVNFEEMEGRLKPHGEVRHNEMVLKFWPARGEYEMTLFPDGRAIIKGTTDAAVARSLYARFIGS